jgi:hypothetical protein
MDYHRKWTEPETKERKAIMKELNKVVTLFRNRCLSTESAIRHSQDIFDSALITTIVHELVSRHVTYQVTQATAARFVTSRFIRYLVLLRSNKLGGIQGTVPST